MWISSCSSTICWKDSPCSIVLSSVVSDSLWPYGLWPCQAPLSMGFFRKEYWSGLPCPSPGDLPDSAIAPTSQAPPALPLVPPRKPCAASPPSQRSVDSVYVGLLLGCLFCFIGLMMDREAWCATAHGVAKSWTWLRNWAELINFRINMSIPTKQLAEILTEDHIEFMGQVGKNILTVLSPSSPATLLWSLIVLIFLVDAFRFSTYVIMSSMIKESFNFFFLNLCTFYPFSYFIASASASSILLKKNSERGHLCLFPKLSGKAYSILRHTSRPWSHLTFSRIFLRSPYWFTWSPNL